MHFPGSGVDCSPLIPPLVAFVIAAATAPAGISGAFLLLPFQVSVLGFASPSVTPTNLIFNLVATPGGIYRYCREGRMAWPVAWVLAAGTLPGVFLGALIRIRYLPDPRSFKVFVGCVLLYLGGRLLWGAMRRATCVAGRKVPPVSGVVKTLSVSLTRIDYAFSERRFAFHPGALVSLALAVGMIGGIYGIGGGAIIAPFLVVVLGLPVHTIAGATLLATFLTSASGVGFYEFWSASGQGAAAAIRPDWVLGTLFGVGGLAGTYAGARLQKFLPEYRIRLGLGLLVIALAIGYLGRFL